MQVTNQLRMIERYPPPKKKLTKSKYYAFQLLLKQPLQESEHSCISPDSHQPAHFSEIPAVAPVQTGVTVALKGRQVAPSSRPVPPVAAAAARRTGNRRATSSGGEIAPPPPSEGGGGEGGGRPAVGLGRRSVQDVRGGRQGDARRTWRDGTRPGRVGAGAGAGAGAGGSGDGAGGRSGDVARGWRQDVPATWRAAAAPTGPARTR